MTDSIVRPNILLIMTDQQRYDSLGCYGFAAAHTPNLDRLASRGTLFERAYVNNPVCTPSRASIMTGKHVPGHGVYRLFDNLPESEVLFPQRLRECGYQTALFGKLHVSSRVTESSRRHPNDGFDVYEWCLEMGLDMDSPFHAYAQWLERIAPEFYRELRENGRGVKHFPRELHMTHWAAERTIEFVRTRDRARPFFAMMSVFDPHNPYHNAPRDSLGLVGDVPPPLPPPHDPSTLPNGLRREMLSKTVQHHVDGSLEAARREYHASIAFVDEEVGRVLDDLERQGILDDTLVIFTSDHGDMLGDRGLMTKGAFFYDACVRVPLIIRWPAGGPRGNRVQGSVQPHDIAATVLAAAGVSASDVDKAMPDSQDLAPLAREAVDQLHEVVVCHYRNSGLNIGSDSPYFDPPLLATMVCDGRYKLSVYHEMDSGTHGGGLLYDLWEDPAEAVDLWDDPQASPVRERLMTALLAWLVTQDTRRAFASAPSTPATFTA